MTSLGNAGAEYADGATADPGLRAVISPHAGPAEVWQSRSPTEQHHASGLDVEVFATLGRLRPQGLQSEDSEDCCVGVFGENVGHLGSSGIVQWFVGLIRVRRGQGHLGGIAVKIASADIAMAQTFHL